MPALELLLAERGVRYFSFADWKKLDAIEVAAGASGGKPREKLTRVPEMRARLGDTAAAV